LTGNNLLMRRVWKIAVIVCAIWLGLLLAFQSESGRRLELAEFDLLTRITAPKSLDVPMVIVGIDDASFAELKLQWPWPRNLHARLIDELRQAGAAVIAFDVVFAEPSYPVEDNLLESAIRRAGNVILAGDLVLQDRQQFSQLIRVDPLNRFLEAGAVAGSAVINVDLDLVPRQLPTETDSFWQQSLNMYFRNVSAEPMPVAAKPDSRVRYFGPDHSFRYVSYYQALSADTMLPEETFRDRIVLIGLDTRVAPELTAGSPDAYPTPFLPVSTHLTPGVEVHATFIANALLQRSISELPGSLRHVLSILVLIVAALAMRNWSPLRSLAVTIAVAVTVMLLAVWMFGTHDAWLPLTLVVLAPFALYVFRGGLAYLAEQRQRIQIRRAFQHYVAPEVVSQIIQHPELLVLGGTRRTITIMFTDLQGFTTMSEQLDPETVSQLLNRHFSEMTRIIHAYGGTVDKYIGDAIMAFWGAPLEDDNHAINACSAAVKMQQAAAVMRREIRQQGMPDVHMRIGIHTGEAIVGNMGSGERFDYTAVGDSVNLASRLEGMCKQYDTGILISEATAEIVGEQMRVEFVDKAPIKGKAEAVPIYKIKIADTVGD